MRDIPLPEYKREHDNFLLGRDPAYIKNLIYDKQIALIAIDTETWYNPEVGGVVRVINRNPNNVPFGMSITMQWGDSPIMSYWLDGIDNILEMKEVLEDENITKILHNCKYDMHILKNIGIDIKGQIWDTMIMIHLIDEEHWCKTPKGTQVMSKKLIDLAYHYLDEDAHVFEDMVDGVRRALALRRSIAKSKISYKEAYDAAPEIMADYACYDTECTYRLCELFLPMMLRQELERAYQVDINATRAVFEMERVGLALDLDYFDALDDSLSAEIDEVLAEISTLIPVELNIRSGRDLVKGFETFGIEWLWFTEKGEYQVDDKVLSQFLDGEMGTEAAQLAALMLQYREAVKLKDTFVAQFMRFQREGRVHADFNVCPRDDNTGGTVTGRLSSSDPNLHNLPKDDDRIRRGVVPTPGYVLVEMDYAQQEYRLLAHYAKDSNFMDIVHEGKDIHTATAEMMFNIPHEEAMKKENRSRGKTLNFSMVYGVGKAALAQNLGYKIQSQTYNKAMAVLRSMDIKPWEVPHRDDLMPRILDAGDRKVMEYYFSDEATKAIDAAGEMRDRYFAQFPAIEAFIKDCRNAAKRRGWVKTWTGRRRHFKDPGRDGYKGPNAVIQGGCGDIIKIKMWELLQFLEPYKSRAVNNIHDSLLLEIHEDEMHLIPEIKKIVEDLPFSVPISCDVDISETSWAELRKFEV